MKPFWRTQPEFDATPLLVPAAHAATARGVHGLLDYLRDDIRKVFPNAHIDETFGPL